MRYVLGQSAGGVYWGGRLFQILTQMFTDISCLLAAAATCAVVCRVFWVPFHYRVKPLVFWGDGYRSVFTKCHVEISKRVRHCDGSVYAIANS